MKLEVELAPNELEEIVSEYLKRNFKSVSSIAFQMQEVEVGNQMQPYKKLIFKGVKCEVEM